MDGLTTNDRFALEPILAIAILNQAAGWGEVIGLTGFAGTSSIRLYHWIASQRSSH